VVCEVPPLVSVSLVHDEPTNPREAQFSMPFAIACIITFGNIELDHLNAETLGDQRLRSAMARVEMRISEELANDPTVPERCPEGAWVSLELADGRRAERLWRLETIDDLSGLLE